jgi:hypothetical protein
MQRIGAAPIALLGSGSFQTGQRDEYPLLFINSYFSTQRGRLTCEKWKFSVNGLRLCNMTSRRRQLDDSTGQKYLSRLSVKLSFGTLCDLYTSI